MMTIPHSDKLSPYLQYFFLQYLPEHRGVSPHTTASYKQTFLQLLRYGKLRRPDVTHPSMDQFPTTFLLDFLSYLEKEIGNGVSTRNVRLAALKSFFKMVALVDPRYPTQCRQILMIPSKRTPSQRFDFLDKIEVDALFAAVDPRSPDGYRDLCILRTLYNTGARASELCAIRIPDLHLDQKQVLLHGKGRKTRIVPWWDTTTVFLSTYLRAERRKPLSPYADFLFINQRRARLTRSGLYLLCRQYLAEAARQAPTIERKKIHPVHGWRRTTATHLLLAGVDVTVIQEWLGHTSIDTTCRYKGVPMETKREALRKFYLFEKSWPETKPEEMYAGWNQDLLTFLQSL